MKKIAIILAVLLIPVICIGADSPQSFGFAGGAGFTDFFKTPGGFYGFNTFIRVDSASLFGGDMFLRTIIGKVETNDNQIPIASAYFVDKFNFIGDWFDVGAIGGVNYETINDDFDFKFGIEFEIAPRSLFGINLINELGQEKLTFTPSLVITADEVTDYTTFQLFINYAR
jgi:hypothetical protein